MQLLGAAHGGAAAGRLGDGEGGGGLGGGYRSLQRPCCHVTEHRVVCICDVGVGREARADVEVGQPHPPEDPGPCLTLSRWKVGVRSSRPPGLGLAAHPQVLLSAFCARRRGAAHPGASGRP